ncbi:hypothetical protein PanWU01x14_106740, partial [Parasponia andersonii]
PPTITIPSHTSSTIERKFQINRILYNINKQSESLTHTHRAGLWCNISSLLSLWCKNTKNGGDSGREKGEAGVTRNGGLSSGIGLHGNVGLLRPTKARTRNDRPHPPRY